MSENQFKWLGLGVDVIYLQQTGYFESIVSFCVYMYPCHMLIMIIYNYMYIVYILYLLSFVTSQDM